MSYLHLNNSMPIPEYTSSIVDIHATESGEFLYATVETCTDAGNLEWLTPDLSQGGETALASEN